LNCSTLQLSCVELHQTELSTLQHPHGMAPPELRGRYYLVESAALVPRHIASQHSCFGTIVEQFRVMWSCDVSPRRQSCCDQRVTAALLTPKQSLSADSTATVLPNSNILWPALLQASNFCGGHRSLTL